MSDPSDLLRDDLAEEGPFCEPDGASVTSYTVPESAAGTRLDKFLPDAAGLSRAAVVRLTENGMVTLTTGAGKSARTSRPDKNTKLKPGDVLTVTVPSPEDGEAQPQDIPLDIVYEDDDLLVVNKPVGMVVHPAPGNPDGTLVNALLWHCGGSLSGIGGVRRPGIVHRIDKDTGGLLVVAKNDFTHTALSEQLKTHTVSRIYTAICVGNIKEENGTVDLPVGRNPVDRKKMATFPKGTTSDSGTVREAVTHFSVLERYPLGSRWGQSFTLIRCKLETGRTHQIRVHMAATGHPLLGDPLYGGDGTRFGKVHGAYIRGQCLYARELDLIHPRTGRQMHFECPLPADFEALIRVLREEAEKA
ncbi:MAG: RluA family pseudouridine synthase [Clostridia bacterium]|nr:RluA family pseudouridine synthase [Clostridia bacterium]